MMGGLVREAGIFRSNNVGVYSGTELIHAGTPANYVPEVMEQLFSWLKKSKYHPLVKSCIFHYEFEFIHPFADGNGRTGRLWQSLILQKWKPFFAWLPSINNEERLKNNVIQENVSRPYGGKTTKYKLGSICPIDDYFLLALTHFDDENKANISVEDYISCLMHMWSEIDKYYSGKPVSLTLLGSGITRFNNAEITSQELLKYLVMTFKASKVKFNNTSSLTIVLNEKIKDEINLYDIKEN